MKKKELVLAYKTDAKTTLRLPRELLNTVRHRAIDEGVTFQAIVEKALVAYLKGGKS
jgi:predicted DNA binding CopG/RHH family protein